MSLSIHDLWRASRHARYPQNVKRPRKYSKTKAVKELARERLGSPKPARVVDDKSLRSKPKHKNKITEHGDEAL